MELQRADPSARLADAQLRVAREHGFASWRKLRAHLDRVRPAGDPAADTAWPDSLMEEFFGAVKRGDEAAHERMLASAPGLANARRADDATALLAAAEVNHTRVIELLLGRGADPDQVYAHSAHTPLSWTVTVGSFDMARPCKNGFGLTP